MQRHTILGGGGGQGKITAEHGEDRCVAHSVNKTEQMYLLGGAIR